MVKPEELLEIMRARRNAGWLKPDPISDEQIETLIEAARWAPSGNNSQPWEFVVVRDEARRKEIDEVMGSIKPGAPLHSHAAISVPVVIVVCADTRLKESYRDGVNRDEVFYSSVASAIQSINLMAVSMGLATSLGTVALARQEPLKKLLEIPEPFEIAALLRVGYPAETRTPPKKRATKEMVHHERFDQSRFRSEEELKKFVEEVCKGWGRL